MTHLPRRASLLIASAALAFASTTTFATAEPSLPADVAAIPSFFTQLFAPAPHVHYHHRHHHFRESLDTRRARYALARACKTGFVESDVCKFTAHLITLAN